VRARAENDELEVTMDEQERARSLSDALDVTAQRKFKRNFAELDETRRHDVAGDVLRSRPELTPPSLRVEGPGSAPSRQSFREEAMRELGFDEAGVASDPLKASMIRNRTAFAERDAAQADVEAEFAEIGRQYHLDPRDYRQRLEIGKIMAQQRHRFAMSERYGSCF
jgi:hypothetical protein